MTEPVWDGRGEDPWLPDRLDARLEIDAVERDIRNTFWAALSRWLVQLSRRIMRDGRPDLDVIAALTPAWRTAVEEIIQGAILPAMQRGYESLMGTAFPWEQRVFVARHLAEVRNRMMRTPEHVFDVIAGEMAEGVNLGEGIPKLAARVEQTLSVTGTARWQNRAVTVARTEAIGALNAARSDAFEAFAEDVDGPLERVWIATDDSRTRPTHALADGQRVPLGQPFIVGGFPAMFPGDPSLPPEESANCRCTLILVEPGESVDLSNRQMRR